MRFNLLGQPRLRPTTRRGRRRALLTLLLGSVTERDLPAELSRELTQAARLAPSALLKRLHSRVDGLSEQEAAERRARLGPNRVAQPHHAGTTRRLWRCYRNPFNLLLTLLAVLSGLGGDGAASAFVAAMVGLATLLRFGQEGRAHRTVERLQALADHQATVLRREPLATPAAEPVPAFALAGAGELPAVLRMSSGLSRRSAELLGPHSARAAAIGHDSGGRLQVQRLSAGELVPGDVVRLAAGDRVPADLRVLNAQQLLVDQAVLSGEALPVAKSATLSAGAANHPFHCDNLCLMGSTVLGGSATAVVVATGARSCFGALAERVGQGERRFSQGQQGVNQVGRLLLGFMAVLAPLALLLNGASGGDWGGATLFALAVAVGLTPQLLPVIATATLARGARRLARQRVIVKRLDAVQDFGAMDILCTDKTGTLTQGRASLARQLDAFGAPSTAVLEYAFLHSYYQAGAKHLLDQAVLDHPAAPRALDAAQAYRKIDELPFDIARRRLSVVLRRQEHSDVVICKGTPEAVLEVCSHVRRGHTVRPLDAGRLAEIRRVGTALQQEGLRVVAVAMRELLPRQGGYAVADECELTLLGYLAFADPARPDSHAALAALREHGVAVKLLTGDDERVAQQLCRELGLSPTGVVHGEAVDALDDAQLAAAARHATVFARLGPSQKARIVTALREAGHVVGFLGDGLNDAPALRAADIGIAVDGAVEVAQEAADVVLQDARLSVLVDGVREGRRSFINLLKYLKLTASANLGNVLSLLVAAVWLPFLPMLPLQLLAQNLLYDLTQLAMPFDRVDAAQLATPQRWQADGLARFMLCFGALSSLFDVATFALLAYGFAAHEPARQALFQSGWFVEGLLSQLLVVHLLRTRQLPWLQSRAAWPLLALTALVAALGLALPASPLAPYLGLVTLPAAYYPWLAALLFGYLALAQGLKVGYARRYGWQ